LIIEHSGGYDSLLAGCDHIDTVVGQWVVAGEPVARMRTGTGNPTLYFEWRRKDQPIDPLSWMAAP
jgi:septal ring factor EnvC (AmiA/AmiB activator)